MAARGSLATLVLLVASTHASSLAPSRIVTDSWRRLGLLRGGDADDGATEEDDENKRGLTRREIAMKLNELPTFCVTNEEGGVAMCRVKGEGLKTVPCVLFFLEPDDALSTMEALQEAMPDTKLKLSLHGLGAAFELCNGWHHIKKSPHTVNVVDPADTTFFASDDPEPAKTPAGEQVEMRIVGNHALVNSTKEGMTALLDENSIDVGSWTLPVFICNQLQSKSVFPAFLRPSDLRKTWLAAGRAEADIPDDIVVVDLRLLVAQMLTDVNDWSRYHLVPSDEAIALAQELQGEPPAAA